MIKQKLTDADKEKQESLSGDVRKEVSHDDEWNCTRSTFKWTVDRIYELTKTIALIFGRNRNWATPEDVALLWWICCCPLILFLPAVKDLLTKSDPKSPPMDDEASKVYDIVTGRAFHGLKAKLCRKTLFNSIQVLVLFGFGVIVKKFGYVLRGTFSVCSIIFKFLLCVPNIESDDHEEGKEQQVFKHIHVEFNAWSYNGTDNLWASLIQTLQEEIYKNYNPRRIKLHRVSVALAGESSDDSFKVRREKRNHALQKFFIKTTVTGILALGGIFAAVYFVFLFNDKCPKKADPSILCNDMVRKMVGSLVGIAGTITFFIKVYTIVFKVWPFFKSPYDILLNGVAKATGTAHYDFRANMGYMGVVQKEMNYLFDFIRTEPIVLPNGVEVLGRLSIFVDDLDRCTPNTIRSVLDAIHLMLETNNSDRGVAICWIAVDTAIVVSSINEGSGSSLRNAGVDGYDYMEKLIQVPFSIPLMTARNKKHLMTKMMTPLISKTKIVDQLILCRNKCNENKRATTVFDTDPRWIDLKILKDMSVPRLEGSKDSWGRRTNEWNLETIKELVGNNKASSDTQQLAKDFDYEKDIFVASKYVRRIEGLVMMLSKEAYSRESTSDVMDIGHTDVEEGLNDNNGSTVSITPEASKVDRSMQSDENENDDKGTLFSIDKHEFVSGSMQPDEERWMLELSHLFPYRARSLKRVINIYTVGRQVAVKTLVSRSEKKRYYDDKFRRKLIKATLLAEVWPCRMAWLLQVAEDVLQEHDVDRGGKFAHELNFVRLGRDDNNINLKEVVWQLYSKKAQDTDKLLTFPDLLIRLPLVDVYRKIVKNLIHAMPQDDSSSLLLHRDEDPQMFELLLQEFDKDLNDVLTMADLHPPDNSSHFNDRHSLRPYIFNLPNHMLQEVTKTLSSILLFLKEEEMGNGDKKKETHLAYKKCSNFYDLDSS